MTDRYDKVKVLVFAPGTDVFRELNDIYGGFTLCPDNAFPAKHPTRFDAALDRVERERADLDRTFVFVTNNPLLVREFDYADVAVYCDGEVAALADHPEIENWRDTMDAGELWTWAGEGWVTDVETDVEWCEQLQQAIARSE